MRLQRSGKPAGTDDHGGGGKEDAVDPLGASAPGPLHCPAVSAATAARPGPRSKTGGLRLLCGQQQQRRAAAAPADTGQEPSGGDVGQHKGQIRGLHAVARAGCSRRNWGPTFNAAADVIATPSVPVAQAVLKPPQLEEMQRYTNELRRLGADNAAYASSTAS
jgi:hypothetical protein